MENLEHPRITEMERCGPSEPTPWPERMDVDVIEVEGEAEICEQHLAIENGKCPQCGGKMTAAFEIEGELRCKTCFVEWVTDYATTNPEDVARYLHVEYQKGA